MRAKGEREMTGGGQRGLNEEIGTRLRTLESMKMTVL